MTTRRNKGDLDGRQAGPAEEGMDHPPDGGAEDAYAYGIAVRQMDALDSLLRMLAAHGDLLAMTRATDLTEGALPAIGEALHTHALAMRDILDQMETQRLGEAPPDPIRASLDLMEVVRMLRPPRDPRPVRQTGGRFLL